MNSIYIHFILVVLFISSCVPSKEKPDDSFFSVNYNTTIRGLVAAGYNPTDTFFYGNYYTNMPAGIEFINTELHTHTGEGMKYIDNELNGKKINYYFKNDTIIKREFFFYQHQLNDSTFFDVSTLQEIFKKENCKCEFVKLDTIRNGIFILWRGLVKSKNNQIHIFEVDETMITIESRFPNYEHIMKKERALKESQENEDDKVYWVPQEPADEDAE